MLQVIIGTELPYNISGEYIDTLQTSFGCDSIVNLNLTISSAQISSDTIFSCDYYLWNGLYLDSSGQYVDTANIFRMR